MTSSLWYSIWYRSIDLFATYAYVACVTDETKLWLSPSAKQRQNHCPGLPPVYQDIYLPIGMKGNSFGNSLSPLGSQNKDIAYGVTFILHLPAGIFNCFWTLKTVIPTSKFEGYTLMLQINESTLKYFIDFSWLF